MMELMLWAIFTSYNNQKDCRSRLATLLKKETLPQVFSCEFWEISKNNFFHRTPPVAASMCTPSVILDLCFILVASNTVIWASLFGAQRFRLEVEDFIFHVVVFSRETLETLAWKFLHCVPQKVFGFIFFLILSSCSI